MTQFLKQNRLVLLIATATLILGGIEFAGRDSKRDDSPTDRSGISADSDVLLRLYPDSPDADYIRGMQARHLRLDLQAARQYFERALASGIKANTNLYYEYAVTLHLMEAPKDEVDTAIAAWKTNDPASGQVPPRSLLLPFPEWNKPASLQVMALSGNAGKFALATDSGAISWIDLPPGDSGEIAATAEMTPSHLLGFSDDGTMLLAADAEYQAALFDTLNGSASHVLNGHNSTVTSGQFSRHKDVCATGCEDGEIRLWDVKSGELRAENIGHHAHPVSAMAFKRDGNTLASGDRHGVIWLTKLNDESGESRFLAECPAAVADLAFSADERLLAAALRDNSIRLYDIRSGECIRTIPGHTAPVSSVAFSPLGRFLVSGSADRTVRFWDASTGAEISVRSISAQDGVCAVAFSRFGDTVVAADYNGSVHPITVP